MEDFLCRCTSYAALKVVRKVESGAWNSWHPDGLVLISRHRWCWSVHRSSTQRFFELKSRAHISRREEWYG